MSDAQDPSEHARTAARARWDPSPLVARSAAIVTERADELPDEQAAPLMARFGVSSWLPLSVRRAQADEERREAAEARQAAAELAERVERRRSQDLSLFAAQAEARGEPVDAIALATGHVAGRSVADVLESARAAADRQDELAEAEERRKRGQKIDFVGELEPPAKRSAAMTGTRRAIEKAAEAFGDSVRAQREADRRRGALKDAVPSLKPPPWWAGKRRSR